MADSKISALTAVTTPAGADEFAVNEAGTSKKVTLTQVATYVAPLVNASTAQQGAGFATDTYLIGSSITLPVSRLQAKTVYHCVFDMSKTSAASNTGAPVVTVRIGTAGSTADASIVALTFAAQTAVADSAVFEIFASFRTVGSGTSAVVEAAGSILHTLAATGFSTSATSITRGTSAGFDSTTASTIIGLSVNGQANAVWTGNLVQAELLNVS